MEPFLTILLLETVTGLSSSVFIIVSLSSAGFQRTNIAPFNTILISLSVSNVFLSIFTSAYLFASSLWSDFYSVSSVFSFLSCMTVYSITSSSWLTAILCFFHFMKIIPSKPGVVMNIKDRIGAIVWRLILMAEIASVGGIFLSIHVLPQNADERNSTINDETLEENRRQEVKVRFLLLILNFLPFIVIIVTTVASAWFLNVYDRQMKKNDGTLVNTNVKDYRSAVQTMTGFLIFYFLFLLAAIISSVQIFVERSAGFWICMVILLSFSTGQSTLLIYSNPKLKQLLKNLFTSLTCKSSF